MDYRKISVLIKKIHTRRKSMFKKITSAVLASAMIVSLAACGSSAPQTTTAAAPAAPQPEVSTAAAQAAAETTAAAQAASGPITLKFSWWGGDSRHEKTLAAVDKFMARYPDIKVECDYGAWSGWTEKISTQLAAGSAADVMQTNWNWLYQFSADGSQFNDLRDFKDVFNDFKDYDQSTLDTCIVGNKLQAMPISTTGKVFYWNKSTYDKAGVALPTTFDELKAAGLSFKEKLGDDYYPMALFEYERFLLMVYYLESKYAKQWAVDNQLNYTVAELQEGLEFINSLEESHVIPSIEHLKGQGAETVEKNPDWICGKYAGFFEWDSAQKKFSDALEPGQEFVLGQYINGFGTPNAGMYKISQTFAIPTSCKNPKEAAMLINYLLSDPEAVEILGTERGIVCNKSAQDFLKSHDMMKGLTVEGNALAMANANYPLDPNFENSALKDTTGAYYEILESLSYGDKPEELAQDLFDAITKVYSDNSF